FLMDKHGDFYMLEVNTRVQVEHPVTEMITGIDIVKEQIRVASGERLSVSQDVVRINGHAIECRINAEDPYRSLAPHPGLLESINVHESECGSGAEDPDRNKAPSRGLVEMFNRPGGFGVRLDTHVHAGYRIPPNSDSMICRLIAHAPTRNEAIARMRRALREF